MDNQEKKQGGGSIHLREVSAEEVELIPAGHLSREDMNEFQSLLDRALQGGHRTIALNFQSVNSLSSSAIGKILHFKKLCDEKGKRLVIRHCSAQMLRLLKMIKFESLIQIEA